MSIQKIEAHSSEAQSADLIADNIAKLKAMFPELLTETTQGGKTTASLNVEVLKNLIGDACYRIAREPGGDTVVIATRSGLYQRPAAPGPDIAWVRLSGTPFDLECPL